MQRQGSLMRRAAATAASVALAALLAAGCGGGDSKGEPAPKPKGEPKAATEPKADDELTDELGTKLEPLVEAGCAYGTYTEEEALHVDSEELKWKTFPPASGTHLQEWTAFGTYDEPVNDGYVVHNLEHGGVAAWLGEGVSDEQRTAIDDLLDDGEKWLVSPREDLLGLAVNAWAKGLSCSPEALEQLEPDALASGIDAWYEAVESTGSEAEKDLPPYAGSIEDPAPTRNISTPAPF